MSLVTCSECGKEISDKASACIHCGNPLTTGKTLMQPLNIRQDTGIDDSLKESNEEKPVNKARDAVDAIFSVVYIYMAYIFFFTDELGEMSSGVAFFGIVLAFVIMASIHKVVRFVVGSVVNGISNITK